MNTISKNLNNIQVVSVSSLNTSGSTVLNNVTVSNLSINTSLILSGTSNTIANIFTSAGNIGINTTGPRSTLDIFTTGGNSSILRSSNTSGIFRSVIQNNTGASGYMGIDGPGFLNTSPGSMVLGMSSGNNVIFTSNNTERMRVTSAGNLGIGTSTPQLPLDVLGSARFSINQNTVGSITFVPTASNPEITVFGSNSQLSVVHLDGTRLQLFNSATQYGLFTNNTSKNFNFYNGSNNPRLSLSSNGNFGINTTSPTFSLDVNGSVRVLSNINGPPNDFIVNNTNSGNNAFTIFRLANDSPNSCNLFLNSTTRTIDGGTGTATLRNDGGGIRIQSNIGSGVTINTAGNTGINTPIPQVALDVGGFISLFDAGVKSFPAGIGTEVNTQIVNFGINSPVNVSPPGTGNIANQGGFYRVDTRSGQSVLQMLVRPAGSPSPTVAIAVSTAGNVSIAGSLSKGSGTFDIKHPIKENKRLVHSFIEGPRCDNIYRGKTTLINGISEVNLDKECVEELQSAMSEGTFVKLNKNIQYYLQNTTSFHKVIGEIKSNRLIIKCEEKTNDIINWMVIGERDDPYIRTWERTSSSGSLITEYDEN